MNADLKHKDISDTVLCCFYAVYNSLGYGFLEKVYENALVHELTKRGIAVVRQHPISVYYDGTAVGEYFADLVVENSIIVEIKAAKCFLAEHEAQILNYLKATKLEVGLLLNFGPKPEFRRKAFDNDRK
jgi:GxxExxY protein